MNFLTLLKKILKPLAVAFSLYSKIPMPRFAWNSSDMKYHFIFFPLVGALIGALEVFWKILQIKIGFGAILYLLAAAAIPLAVTGGIHFDGFMDTADALSSYGPREKKLEILKDPHIGAFSVIFSALYFLLLLGFASEIKSLSALVAVCFSFVFSRIFSALGVIFLKKAKNDGMAKTESENSAKKTVGAALLAELAIFSFLLVFILRLILKNGSRRIFLLLLPFFLALAISCVSCALTAKKNFGGVTGDTAGFFVCVSELLCVVFVSSAGIAARSFLSCGGF